MVQDHLHNSAAYGGSGWSPRKVPLSQEIGTVWGQFGQSNEWGPLKAVMMHRPGPELFAAKDPDSVQMLDTLDLKTARRQHAQMIDTFSKAGVTVFEVAPLDAVTPNQMFVADLFFIREGIGHV